MNKILLSQKIHPKAMAMLEGKYELLIPSEPGQEAFEALLPEAEGIILRTNVKATKDVIAKAKNLKIISRTGAGVDNVDVEAAKAAGVIVTNTPRANSISVAEHAVALALACAKDLPGYDKATRGGNWAIRSTNHSIELFGKTVGIVGLGHIGRLAADMFHSGFKMDVIGFDPFVKQEVCPEYTVTANIEDVFKNADVISLHCPSLPSTRGIVNKNTLALAKKGIILVNCARGDIVVEEDVIAAIKDGTIAAAGLDVFKDEPIDPNSEYLSMENVIITPHSAALTREASINMATQAAEQQILYFSGEKPQYLV